MENLLSDLQGRVELEGGPGSLGTVNRNKSAQGTETKYRRERLRGLRRWGVVLCGWS